MTIWSVSDENMPFDTFSETLCQNVRKCICGSVAMNFSQILKKRTNAVSQSADIFILTVLRQARVSDI